MRTDPPPDADAKLRALLLVWLVIFGSMAVAVGAALLLHLLL